MTPKAFISYSWTNSAHEAWVLRLAEGLVESGVDVVLDKWNLREGHDKFAFMEQMVTDPSVTKVIMVCDKAYAAKADGRTGGVGTEAQVITPKLYGNGEQDRFVAVVAELDEHGKPYVPTFYTSRIHIDMADDARYAEGFERLLRWAYSQPVHTKPKLGAKPAFLDEADRPRLATDAKHRRAVDQVRSGSSHAAAAAANEFFDAVVAGLGQFRVESDPGNNDTFDEVVVKNLTDMLPYRDQCLAVIAAMAQYSPDDDLARALSRFIEGLLPYMDAPEGLSQWRSWDFDNYRFMAHEFVLHAVALLIRHERFVAAGRLLGGEFYRRSGRQGGKMVGYGALLQQMATMEHRRQKLRSRAASPRAEMLKERCKGTPYDFETLMQADFILYLRAKLDENTWWYTETVPYMSGTNLPFEIFARMRSRAYCDRVLPMLGTPTLDAFKEAVGRITSDGEGSIRYDYRSIPIKVAVGLDEVGTRS